MQNPELAEAFFNLRDGNPRVIFVTSKSISVIEAKLSVFRKYTDFMTGDNISISHEYDDNDELAKLSALYQSSVFLSEIQKIRKSLSLHILHKVVQEIYATNFLKEVILKECVKVVISTDDIERYSEKISLFSTKIKADHFRQMLVRKTIQRLCSDAIMHDLMSKEIGNTTSGEIFTGILARTLHIHVTDDLNWFSEKAGPTSSLDDINTETMREDVGRAIYELITERKIMIQDSIVEICLKTQDDLQNLCMVLKTFKACCRHKHIFECKYIFIVIQIHIQVLTIFNAKSLNCLS